MRLAELYRELRMTEKAVDILKSVSWPAGRLRLHSGVMMVNALLSRPGSRQPPGSD